MDISEVELENDDDVQYYFRSHITSSATLNNEEISPNQFENEMHLYSYRNFEMILVGTTDTT